MFAKSRNDFPYLPRQRCAFDLPRTIHTPINPILHRSLLAGSVIYPGLFGAWGFSDELPDATLERKKSTSEIDYGGRRTRILIFALAMFQVRPEVNWMLIAVDSWSYIRGTLSPSPPGGPSDPRPQVVYPHVTPLCSATTTTVPPSRATTTPLWDRRPTSPPLTNTRATKKHSSPSLTNRFYSLPPSLNAHTCDAWLLFFLLTHIFASTFAMLWFYMLLSLRNDGHTNRIIVNSPWCWKLPTWHRSHPRVFPVQANAQINPVH